LSPDLALLAAGGLAAGVVNTLAGGGTLLTVPLLVMLGLPGNLANGTNRVGILAQNLVAARRFRIAGVASGRDALPVLAPVLLGSAAGALAVGQLSDAAFERVFGAVMLALLVPTLRGATASARSARRPWPKPVAWLVYFAVGLYGGAIQAGVGIFLVYALARDGSDLVRANAVKVLATAALTAVALPVFAAQGRIEWSAAAALALGFAAGGELGARLAVRGGERLLRPLLAAAVVALAARMLGLF
jgi:uncharacterized membrane protein YfcA